MLDKKIQDALDACRPHHDDLHLPAMEVLAQALASQPELGRHLTNSQRLDSQISQAMHDIPVPTSLAPRLLKCVRENARGQVEPESNSALDENDVCGVSESQSNNQLPEPQVRSRSGEHLNRRRWAICAAVAVAASVLVAMGWNWMNASAVWTRESLGEQAPHWVARLSADWQPADTSISKEFPVANFVSTVPRRWQIFVNSQRQRGVAFDLQRNRGEAFLFVLRAPADISLATVPRRLSSSGGWGLGAWQSGGLVYVLMVNEQQQRLEDFMRSSPPLA